MAGRGLGGASWGAGRRGLGPGKRSVRTRSCCRARSTDLASLRSCLRCSHPPLSLAGLRRVPAALRSLRLAQSLLGALGQSVSAVVPRRWPLRSTKRLAGRRTTWCATTARQSSGEELSIALQAPHPKPLLGSETLTSWRAGRGPGLPRGSSRLARWPFLRGRRPTWQTGLCTHRLSLSPARLSET